MENKSNLLLNCIKFKWFLIYGAIGIAFIILATTVGFKLEESLEIIRTPFEKIGEFLRHLLEASNGFVNVLGYAFYIILSMIPLAYPVYMIIKNREFRIDLLLWLIASVLLFVVNYYLINPNRIPVNEFIPFSDAYVTIHTIGLIDVFLGVMILAILFSINYSLRKKEEKVYLYSKLTIVCVIALYLFSCFYLELSNLISNIKSINAMDSTLNINKSDNVFLAIASYMATLIPTALSISLLGFTQFFLNKAQNDLLCTDNIKVINRITFVAKLDIAVSIAAMTIMNLLTFCFADVALDSNYNLTISSINIFLVLIIIIFSKLLAKAIEVNEENKLVI